MSDEELMESAAENVAAVKEGLRVIAELGRGQPVPAQMFTIVLARWRPALSAVMELERRARGGEPARVGDQPPMDAKGRE